MLKASFHQRQPNWFYTQNVHLFPFLPSFLQNENEARKKKEQKEKELKELNEIFRPVISKQKVETGVDPKSILCAFFKQGQCTKGDKCKFSHDLLVERKSAKKDIYTDIRDVKEGEVGPVDIPTEADEIGADGRVKNFHICNHFLEAVENNKFGWFWVWI